MYSMSNSFLTTTEGLFASIAPLGQSMSNSSSNIFAAPLTIDLKLICTFCENSYELANGISKSREMKQVEDIALEHFKRRVLNAREESLSDLSMIFPDDLDGTRQRKLLGSITLCNECICHFARNEEVVLKDQLEYLGKMSGAKRMEDVLADPWLDVKRLAFQHLKCQEPTIREKLTLIETVCSSAKSSKSSSTGTTVVPSLIATSTPNHPSTSTSQLLLTSINFPVTSESRNDVVNMDICEGDVSNQVKHPSTCELPTSTAEKGSTTSSIIGSPIQDKDNDSSNDNEALKNMEENITVSARPSGSCQQQEHSLNEPESHHNMSGKEEVAKKKSCETSTNDDGQVSETESVRSVRNTIPSRHKSPIVCIKPISVLKTPTPTSKASKASAASPSLPPSVKKLNLDEVEDLLNADDDSEGSNELVIDEEVDGGKSDENKKPDNANKNTISEKEDQDGKGQNSGNEKDGEDDKVNRKEALVFSNDNKNGNEASTTPSSVVGDVDSSENQGKTGSNASTVALALNQKIRKSIGNKAPKPEYEFFEDSDDPSDDSCSDGSYGEPETAKGGKRKRNPSGGQKRKGLKVKMAFSKQPKRKDEKELSLTSPAPNQTLSSSMSGSLKKHARKHNEKSDIENDAYASPSRVTSPKKGKKSNAKNDSSFATPTPPIPIKKKDNADKSKSGVDLKKSKSKLGNSGEGVKSASQGSVQEKVGKDKTVNKKSKDSSKNPPPPPAKGLNTTPNSAKNQKKYFKIGNRYMTESSSTDEDSEDDDPTFTADKTDSGSD